MLANMSSAMVPEHPEMDTQALSLRLGYERMDGKIGRIEAS
jgi:hypothetical protein